jgi:hypothetical protein
MWSETRDVVRSFTERLWRRDRLRRAARRPVPGPDTLVVVLGLEHSGAAWVHDVVAADPDASRLPGPGVDETDVLLRATTMREQGTWAAAPIHFALDPSDASVLDVERLRRQWFAALRPRGARIGVEHSPENAVRGRFLAAAFPEARFVVVHGDPAELAAHLRGALGLPLDLAARHAARGTSILARDAATLAPTVTLRTSDLRADPSAAAAAVRAAFGLRDGPVPPPPPRAPPLTEAERAVVSAEISRAPATP